MKMNKNIFITGEAKITSLLCDYISAEMKADFTIVNKMALSERNRQRLRKADVVILMHEIGTDDIFATDEKLAFTQEIIQSLPQFVGKASVVYFAPRKGNADDHQIRTLKFQGEQVVRSYCSASGATAILYRMPLLFGPGFQNTVLDRLISSGKTLSPADSHGFLHIRDFMHELYRMVNGAPAFVGHDSYAYPAGVHFSTEGEILKKIASFRKLSSDEIPSFSSSFERNLFDYFLSSEKPGKACKLDGDTVLSCHWFGKVSVKKLLPGEKYTVCLNGVSGLRLFLLCGSIKINRSSYCAEPHIIRINLAKDTIVENIGDETAVIEMWSHSNS